MSMRRTATIPARLFIFLRMRPAGKPVAAPMPIGRKIMTGIM